MEVEGAEMQAEATAWSWPHKLPADGGVAGALGLLVLSPQHPAANLTCSGFPWVTWSWLTLCFQARQFSPPEQVAATWAEPRL